MVILTDEDIEFFLEENQLRLEIMKIITTEMEIEEEIDNLVRERIESYNRLIREGTNEWEVLYQKHYIEESTRKRGVTL